MKIEKKTYSIHPEILYEHLKNTTYKNIKVGLPIFASYSHTQVFETNCINSIPCSDKKGYQFEFINGPQVEVRFTTKFKKRSVLYFDTLRLDSEYIAGCRSRFFSSLKQRIPSSHILKIEIQDSGKKYEYS